MRSLINVDCFIFALQMKHKESPTVREAPPASPGGLGGTGGVFGPSKTLAKKEGGLVSQIASKFQNNSDTSSPGSSKFFVFQNKMQMSIIFLKEVFS